MLELNIYLILFISFVCSLVVLVIIVLISEFNLIKRNVSRNITEHMTEVPEAVIVVEDIEQIENKINITESITQNKIIEVTEPTEIIIPDNSIKKDVFLHQNGKVNILKQGVVYKLNDAAKIEAFFYGEPYEIFMR